MERNKPSVKVNSDRPRSAQRFALSGRAVLLSMSTLLVATLAAGALVSVIRNRANKDAGYLPTPVAEAAEIDPWTLAVRTVSADRGEPVGRQAKVEIPAQVRHYSDTRRFLAVQTAEWLEHRISTPADMVELASMIQRGEMAPLPQLTENFVLLGVGWNSSEGPFTRYRNGRSVGLFDEAGLEREYERLAKSSDSLKAEIAELRKELSTLGRRARKQRSELNAQMEKKQKDLKQADEQNALLKQFYGNVESRQSMLNDYQLLVNLARSQPDREFSLEDPVARREFKMRLLSAMRPEARKVLEEIALAYREKFSLPLPITSLVRTDEYQRRLSRVNPNATLIETPPHSTGLAFDVFYGYMTAAEQAHLMHHLAKLKDEGRIEVLRENRDHYHVFAFLDGARPSEQLIQRAMRSTVKR